MKRITTPLDCDTTPKNRDNPTLATALDTPTRNLSAQSVAPQSVPLADLYRTPYRLSLPRGESAPLVFALPHSGRAYPDSFIASAALPLTELRRSEDAYIDLLFDAARMAAPMIMARFPRAFVDVNRSVGELDPAMFDGPLDQPMLHTPHTAAGLGVIPRIVREGVEIYPHKLLPLEAHERLERLYHPYHVALAALVARARSLFPHVVVIDCHSMPSGPHLADIVIGDRHGHAAPERLVRLFETSFTAEGFTVARNQPYAGGYTTACYGQQDEGSFAIQIEVNRALYMKEESVEPNSAFEQVRCRITNALQQILRRDIAALCESGGKNRLAAE
ncbi:MAG: N-formylglutamate amidohydrolase [Rhizomicrobium sp.]